MSVLTVFSLVSAVRRMGSILQRTKVTTVGRRLKLTIGMVTVSIVMGGKARLMVVTALISG